MFYSHGAVWGPCQYWLSDRCYANSQLEGTSCGRDGRCQNGKCVTSNTDLVHTLSIPTSVEVARLIPHLVSQTRLKFNSVLENFRIKEATSGMFQMKNDCDSDETSCHQEWFLLIENTHFCTSSWYTVTLLAESTSYEIVSNEDLESVTFHLTL